MSKLRRRQPHSCIPQTPITHCWLLAVVPQVAWMQPKKTDALLKTSLIIQRSTSSWMQPPSLEPSFITKVNRLYYDKHLISEPVTWLFVSFDLFLKLPFLRIRTSLWVRPYIDHRLKRVRACLEWDHGLESRKLWVQMSSWEGQKQQLQNLCEATKWGNPFKVAGLSEYIIWLNELMKLSFHEKILRMNSSKLGYP